MADSLYELLSPYLNQHEETPSASRSPPNATTVKYIERLSTLSLDSLTTTEPQSLSQTSHSTLLSLQALSNRSHKAVISSSDHLSSLRTLVPSLANDTYELRNVIPKLDEEAIQFSSNYSKSSENVVLDRRKKSMQLIRTIDRISDILELPALLATAVSSSSATSTAASGSSSSSINYSSALDLYSHIKRLQALYPDSPLIHDIVLQAEDAMRDMTTNLIAALRTQNIRLAAAIRTVGWLRRVAPELERPQREGDAAGGGEGAFGALFLICRLANLVQTLEALEPLRELADQETQRRLQNVGKERKTSSANTSAWSGGQQTERFLKRYIEIYREQSFAIVSLYKNIFALEQADSNGTSATTHVPNLHPANLKTKAPSKRIITGPGGPFQSLPPAVATFPMHLVGLLSETLRTYLPNVQDKSSRESLLTQVLYCAASLGRLGGDFGMILTELEDIGDRKQEGPEGSEERSTVPEWETVMRNHRALSGKLEQLTGGAGTSSI
jgi:hypothetical protein